MVTPELQQRCIALVEELGLGKADDVRDVRPLTGGVASDVVTLSVGGKAYCVKFALAKLRVAEDWQAPVHRNAAEYAWLTFASTVDPQSAVKVFGHSPSLCGFAMEYIAGEGVFLWKASLLAGKTPEGAARRVGDLLGRIHAASTRENFDATPFQNRDDFSALRIEPYITFLAPQYPKVASTLGALAEALFASEQVLVHGDVSPKNILFRAGAPVLLDAECATMGDASFDPAFCLNHLLLKAVHLPASRAVLLGSTAEFWRAYAHHWSAEEGSAIEKRVARLLPALLLARVDGKSPVEYLSARDRAFVRTFALRQLEEPPAALADLVGALADALATRPAA